MSVDYSQMTKAQLILALETMQEWARARVKDEQERPSSNLVLMEIRNELRRMNEGRDQFHREVLDVLSTAKSGDVSSLRSEQPAALRCEVCGKAGHVPRCIIGPLTREQWKAHHASVYQRCMDNGGYKTEALALAGTRMRDQFGPCPEES